MVSTLHCWVCDDHGGLHVLKNCADLANQKWVTVDNGFRNIYAGYGGLVCGIKGCSLYIRKYVSRANPIGTGWMVCACDVIKVMPGRVCVVRRPSKGCLLAARVDLEVEVLDWNPIPPCREESSEQLHHVMDDGDRLFTVTGNGAVFCCEPLIRDPYWYRIATPPNLGGSGLGILSKLWSNIWSDGDAGDGRDWVSTVSVGSGCIWCLREGTREAWQLVVGWVDSVPKVNWTQVKLPLSEDESIVTLSAGKSARSGVYAIVRGGGYFKMVSCLRGSAGEDGDGGDSSVDIALPVRYPCWSLAVCSTQTAPHNHRKRPQDALPNGHIPLPKRVREVEGGLEGGKKGGWGGEEEMGGKDCHDFLHRGVVVTCNRAVVDTVEVDTLEIPSIENIKEEFQYDFSMEHKIVNEWYQWNTG